MDSHTELRIPLSINYRNVSFKELPTHLAAIWLGLSSASHKPEFLGHPTLIFKKPFIALLLIFYLASKKQLPKNNTVRAPKTREMKSAQALYRSLHDPSLAPGANSQSTRWTCWVSAQRVSVGPFRKHQRDRRPHAREAVRTRLRHQRLSRSITCHHSFRKGLSSRGTPSAQVQLKNHTPT